jgi:hypothetical protein
MLVREFARLVAGSGEIGFDNCKVFMSGLPATQAGCRGSGKDRLIPFSAADRRNSTG